MKKFGEKLDELLTNEKQVKRLLALEKARRSVPENRLLCIAISNVAGYYWCGLKAVLKSKIDEPAAFASYLQSRLYYSHQLGLICELPENGEALLDVGNTLTFEDMQKILRSKQLSDRKTIPYATMVVDHKPVVFVNPHIAHELRMRYEQALKMRGITIGDSTYSPRVRGQFLEAVLAEPYVSMRWFFPWEKHIIDGAPDGITDRFVYEFKTTKDIFNLKPVAFAQADIYGYFFRRNQKRVQMYLLDKAIRQTWETDVDKDAVERCSGKGARGFFHGRAGLDSACAQIMEMQPV